MVRLEIIGNLSVEEELLDAFTKAEISFYYTKLSGVKGKGSRGEKQMNSVWPEENFLLLTYVQEELACKIKEIVYDIKCEFPKEGLNVFEVKALDFQEPERVLQAQALASRSVSERLEQMASQLNKEKRKVT